MGKTQSSYLSINGLSLHISRSGSGKIPLVLLHGITDDALCWGRVAAALAERCDIVMLDARGHGRSQSPDQEYTYETMAEDVAGVVRALGLVKPFVLGHSMGAATALALAGLYPELPRAILLEDPPPLWNFPLPQAGGNGQPSEEARQGLRGLIDWMEGVKRMTQAELLAEVRSDQPEWAEEEVGPWAESKQRFSLRVVDYFLAGRQMAQDFSSLARRITCPALFIQADPLCGAASSPEDVARLKALMPGLQVEMVAGAGHSIHRGRYEQYLRIVRQALAIGT